MGGIMQGELRVPRLRAASAALVVVAAVAASVTMGSAAIAGSAGHIPRQPGAPAHIHYLPSHPSAQPTHTASNLIYHGGPVMLTSKTYAIFWEPKKLQNGKTAFVAKGYNAGIIRYFKDVGGNGLYNINTQYYQGSGASRKNIKNNSTFAESWVDTHPYPASGCTDPATPGNCITDAQIQAEVTHAKQVNGWSGTPTNAFFVFTASGEGSCFGASGSCAFTSYCGYHGNFSGTIYANMPYGATHTPKPQWRIFCTRTALFPNQRDVDMETNILSHEHIEMVTDPALNAWFDSGGQEIGDLCSYNYGTRDEDNGTANQKWNGHFYLLQQEWNNHVSGCSQDGP
jgi:hypothetical protein